MMMVIMMIVVIAMIDQKKKKDKNLYLVTTSELNIAQMLTSGLIWLKY